MKKISGFRFQFLAILAAFVWPLSTDAADGVPHWQVLPEKSNIEWTAIYGGKPVKGSFPDFSADIAFDPKQVDKSKVTVKITTGKVKSDDKDAQENLPGKDWLSVADFPVAVFETDTIKFLHDDDYEAKGTLSLRGKTAKTVLFFEANFYDDNATSPPTRYARIVGLTTLKRLDFGVGQGDWANTDAVADDVKVVVRLEAKQVP